MKSIIIKRLQCSAFLLLLPAAFIFAQPKGWWVKHSVKDEMTNETELKKRNSTYSFLGKAGSNGQSFELKYYSNVDRKTHTYRGHVKWEWTVKRHQDSLLAGELVTIKGLVSNLSAEPTGNVTAWADFGTWGFMKPASGKSADLNAGPNGTATMIGSFTVPKGPGLKRDGTLNPYFSLTFHLSGGNESRFIRRIITYKWVEFGVQPEVKAQVPVSEPVVTPPPPPAEVNTPQLYTGKNVYKVGEPIVVVFKNLPGFNADWIGIYGAKAYHANEYIEWKYTKGLKEGTMTFTSPRYGAGDYMFRVYENNGYKLLAQSVAFKVVN